MLEPLAARYATWLGLPAQSTASMLDPASRSSGDTTDEDPATVRAMPIVLRIERQDPAPRTALLEAAATAALAVCLAPEAQPEGEWHDEVRAWVDGRIRKVSRRARGAHWDAIQDLPGITVTHDGAEVRALVPGLVAESPRVLSRLQISGSELPEDNPGPPPGDRPVLWLNPKIEMTVGKAAAQVGHATMIGAALLPPEDLARWSEQDYACAVRTATPADWAELLPGPDPALAWRERRVAAVRDAGFTEVAPGTVTVLFSWPH
ncbi:peptidyl-tRNA hydrolase [Crossiella sp. CA-258035]|uniref:peptidyl-tRNA hydrolase n=1 Tax=Crossiella sp. CA-258035 TaxID=2981138 RepID=UPI0024BCB9D5|nr:peptidyl-tRNA hydrolase [Crossiella sp. CA-258035]WHT18375.1 peptidyl-tRNA hydrolase [Crossiella sp. CA-258035]